MPTTTPIANAATGAVVSARSGFAIRVLAWSFSWSGTTNLKWQSSGGPTDLTGLFYGVANSQFSSGGLGLDQNRGHFQTLSGEALNLNNSGSVAVGGHVVWEYVSQ